MADSRKDLTLETKTFQVTFELFQSLLIARGLQIFPKGIQWILKLWIYEGDEKRYNRGPQILTSWNYV